MSNPNMHLSSLLVFSELLTLGLAFLQRPLTALKDQSQTPLDDVFSKKVEWALEHFQIPGVGVAVVRDDEVFAKVSVYFIITYYRGEIQDIASTSIQC